MFKKLDPLLHSELRLAVMSVLVNLEEADFVYLREATGATAGNLSVQIDKLTTAGYISVEKDSKEKSLRPSAKSHQPVCRHSKTTSKPCRHI